MCLCQNLVGHRATHPNPDHLGEFEMTANSNLASSNVDAAHIQTRLAMQSKLAAPYRTMGKRILDMTLVVLMAPSVLLVVAVLCLLIVLDGAAPFYRQRRVGRGGKEFSMWKLRSMVPNADTQLAAYLDQNPEARAEWDRDQKLTHDPRITRVGRLIRRTSLDELPQLWNVLKGEMSLVGPRPMMPCQRSLYPGNEYYEMAPGITGLWQTSVRNESSFADRAAFDAQYHNTLSLGMDLRLLAATVRVVLNATGR